jgi:hypothetical protein
MDPVEKILGKKINVDLRSKSQEDVELLRLLAQYYATDGATPDGADSIIAEYRKKQRARYL